MTLRIAYFGTAAFAVPPLEALLGRAGEFEVVAVITQPDKPAGREKIAAASPVAAFAAENRLRLLQPATLKTDAVQTTLAALDADVFLVAAYGKIVPKAILALPRLGCLNLHGSLLPKYRGASPIQTAILAGETETGVSLMLMDEAVDHGPVLATAAVPIATDDTHGSLERKLAVVASRLLVDNLGAYAAGVLAAKGQHHDEATFTKILTREDGLVDWREDDAAAVERKRRAFDPWPGIYAVWIRNDKPLRIKILKLKIIEDPGAMPGAVVLSKNGLPAVGCKDNAVELIEVQPEGKKPMQANAFLNGYPDFVGSALGGENS